MHRLSFALPRTVLLGVCLVLVFALAACSTTDSGNGGNGGGESTAASAGAGSGGGTATVENGAVDMSAADLAFDVSTIEAPAGETWTITFTNNDSAPHNVAIYTEEGGDPIVVGDVINGGETTTIEVPALDAGTYYFHCDVHPEMNGSVVVS
jgi:plastocyanin